MEFDIKLAHTLKNMIARYDYDSIADTFETGGKK